MARSGRSRTRVCALVALLLGALVLVSACGGGGGGKSAPGPGSGAGNTTAGNGKPGEAPKVDPATITLTPADGAQGVDVTAPVGVTVGEGGKLGTVKVTNASHEDVDGAMADDGKTWKPKQPFSLGGRYTVTATATNSAGQVTTATAAFTTASPDKKITASFTPEDGSTVGVGQPVSITFNAPVKDRAAAEKALTVTTSPAVDGSWHWFGNERLDYRPKTSAGQFWTPGTKVTVDLNLRGVDLGGGEMSSQYKTFSFTISPNKIVSVVDVKAKTLTVKKNDQVVKTIPVTTGETPDYATWGGYMVVQEKYTKTRMNSQTVGLGNEYDIDDVPWAVRITTSGTFVHGNYWSDPSTFGSQNSSHGCISMVPANAKWFYDNAAHQGDVVQVVNAQEQTVAPDNGFGDWNLSWSQWVSGSALHGSGE